MSAAPSVVLCLALCVAGSATQSRLQVVAATVLRVAISDVVAAMIHPSLQAATEVLLEKSRSMSSFCGFRQQRPLQACPFGARQVWDLWEHVQQSLLHLVAQSSGGGGRAK